MLFELLDQKRIDDAAGKFLSYRDDHESRGKILDIVSMFHDSETWEKICNLAEDNLVELIKPMLKDSVDVESAAQMHMIIMALTGVAFTAGFDSGYNLQIEQSVEKLGGLS